MEEVAYCEFFRRYQPPITGLARNRGLSRHWCPRHDAEDVVHSLGLTGEGAIVAWGRNYYGETDAPAPNTGFIAVAAGDWHSLGLKANAP